MSRTSVGSIWKETSATFVEHARFAFLLSVDTYQQGNTEWQSLKNYFYKRFNIFRTNENFGNFICNQYISYSIFFNRTHVWFVYIFGWGRKKLLKVGILLWCLLRINTIITHIIYTWYFIPRTKHDTWQCNISEIRILEINKF